MSGSGLKVEYCCTSLRRPRVETLVIVRRPPVAQYAPGIELAALVVEAVADFVADHGADSTVIDRVVGLHVEERRLQDRGRENDLVGEWIVVSIDGLRRHDPFGLVDGPIDLGEFAPDIDHARIHDVADEVVRLECKTGIFLPFVRIGDLHGEIADLFQRSLACVRAHPVEFADADLEGLQQVADQLVHAAFCFRRKMTAHVLLAEQVADRVLHFDQRALPARLELWRAEECVRIEVEVFLHERRA